MTQKVVDLTQRLANKPVDFDDADAVLEQLLKLKTNQMMVVFNDNGVLRYTIQTITARFRTEF